MTIGRVSVAGFVLALALAAPAAPVLALQPAPVAALQSAANDSAPGTGIAAPRLSDAGEARARALEGKLKCPVCRTQSVLESTSFMALEMRAKIRELIAAGRSDAEIIGFFADRYGDYILLEPRKKGFGLSAYLLPGLAVFSGAVLVGLWIRRRTRGSSGSLKAAAAEPAGHTPAAPASTLSADDGERVAAELKRYTV